MIGTIGKQCGRANWDCVIVTGDRDSLQLIDEHVTVKLVSSSFHSPSRSTMTLPASVRNTALTPSI